jgi:acetyl esterase/lipase
MRVSLQACAALYAGSHHTKDPLISPVYGDFTKGFPPAILTSGTRDMLLSDKVRIHRKLRQAGVETYLQIFEGMSHAQYILVFTSPESREAFQEIASFFAEPSWQVMISRWHESIKEGSREIQKLIIAKDLLREHRSD